MSKLILFNLMVQLSVVYWSNVSVTPLSNAGQTTGGLVKRQPTTESGGRETNNEPILREKIVEKIPTEFAQTDITTESEQTETSTESGLRKTTTESKKEETTKKHGLKETIAELGLRETTMESQQEEITTKHGLKETIAELGLRETTMESQQEEITTKHGLKETIADYGFRDTTTESEHEETTTEHGINETTTEHNLKETTTGHGLKETITEPVLRETTMNSGEKETASVTDMRGTIKEMMETVCPLVDICDANSTSADLKPNGVISRGRASCCRGCSCHPDCKERMNCCYPQDFETVDDTEQGSSPYQCLYTRLGQEQHMFGTVPAYRTVVAPPVTSCVDSRPLRMTSDVVISPTCDDIDVTPLVPYAPVYSKETGDIYKNILCARCHGVKRTEAFQTILVCKRDKRSPKPQSPMSENLGFLESKALSPKCHVDFKHTKPSDLYDKRCYKDLIETCTSDRSSHLHTLLEGNLISPDFATIQDLCENGIVSPTLLEKAFYKNIFCAMCAQTSTYQTPLLCINHDFHARAFGESFSFLLDPKIMHTIERLPKERKLREQCVTIQETKTEVCRTIHCPLGKIKASNGDCVLAVKSINNGGIFVMIKLTPTEAIDFNELAKVQATDHLIQSVLKNNPWPNDWTVNTIVKRIDQTNCHEKAVAVVYLVPEDKGTDDVFRDVGKFTRLTWPLDLKNKTYSLTQSILDYEIKNVFIEKRLMLIPSWQVNNRKQNLTSIFLGCGPMEWKTVFSKFHINGLFVPNKLYFCDQIELMQEEFTLGPDNTYLESNLTKRVLFDMEFDLMEDEDGLKVRVCLENTIFSTTKASDVCVLEAAPMVLLIPLLLSFSFHL